MNFKFVIHSEIVKLSIKYVLNRIKFPLNICYKHTISFYVYYLVNLKYQIMITKYFLK